MISFQSDTFKEGSTTYTESPLGAPFNNTENNFLIREFCGWDDPQVDSRVHLMAAHLGRFKTLASSSSEGANHVIIEYLASMSTQQDKTLRWCAGSKTAGNCGMRNMPRLPSPLSLKFKNQPGLVPGPRVPVTPEAESREWLQGRYAGLWWTPVG